MPSSTVSVEVEKPNREGLVELAAEADVIFYSRSWAEVSSCRSCGVEYMGDSCRPLNCQSGPRIHQCRGLPEGRGPVIKGVSVSYRPGLAAAAVDTSWKRSSLMLCTWGAQGAGSLSLPSGEYIHRPANMSGNRISVVE